MTKLEQALLTFIAYEPTNEDDAYNEVGIEELERIATKGLNEEEALSFYAIGCDLMPFKGQSRGKTAYYSSHVAQVIARAILKQFD
jgi:hypothetical protein